MTKFDVLVIYSTEDRNGETIETVEANTPHEAMKIAEDLHENTEEYDVEAIKVWLAPV